MQAMQQAIQNLDVRVLQMINLSETNVAESESKGLRKEHDDTGKHRHLKGTACLISRKISAKSDVKPAESKDHMDVDSEEQQEVEVVRFVIPANGTGETKLGSSLFAQLLTSKIGEGWVQQPAYSIEVREHTSLALGMHEVRIGEIWGTASGQCKIIFMLVRLASSISKDSGHGEDEDGGTKPVVELSDEEREMHKLLVREFVKSIEASNTTKPGLKTVEDRWWEHGGSEAEWAEALRAVSIATGVDKRASATGSYGI